MPQVRLQAVRYYAASQSGAGQTPGSTPEANWFVSLGIFLRRIMSRVCHGQEKIRIGDYAHLGRPVPAAPVSASVIRAPLHLAQPDRIEHRGDGES
jgi:hypothetical protein